MHVVLFPYQVNLGEIIHFLVITFRLEIMPVNILHGVTQQGGDVVFGDRLAVSQGILDNEAVAGIADIVELVLIALLT